MINVLYLTLKKKWFDMVGETKPEEYREIKQYWINRLTWHEFHWLGTDTIIEEYKNNIPILKNKFYDIVEFKNGYSKNAPTKKFKFNGIEIGFGKPEWGAESDQQYFIIKLGDIIT